MVTVSLTRNCNQDYRHQLLGTEITSQTSNGGQLIKPWLRRRKRNDLKEHPDKPLNILFFVLYSNVFLLKYSIFLDFTLLRIVNEEVLKMEFHWITYTAFQLFNYCISKDIFEYIHGQIKTEQMQCYRNTQQKEAMLYTGYQLHFWNSYVYL